MAVAINPIPMLTPLNGTVGGSTNSKTNLSVSNPVNGSLVSNSFDLGTVTNALVVADLMKCNVPIATAMPAGSLQWEYSADGNGFAPNVVAGGAPTAIAVTAAVEGSYPLLLQNKSFRYGRVRFIPTGGVTLSAIQTAAATTPASAVNALAMTPDELYLAMVTTTAAGVNVYGFAQTTTPLAAAATTVNANILVGTTAGIAGANFCPRPLAETNNVYYLAAAGGTTPFLGIMPISSTGVSATVIQPTAGAITAGKCAFWHPLNSSGYSFVGYVGTTTPYLAVYLFNLGTGALGVVQSLGTIPSVGNLTFAEFSPDGNYLMVCGGTAPYVQIFPVTITVSGGVPAMTLGAAITTPATSVAAAALCCRWHPRMERVAVATATTVLEYAIYRQPGGAIMGSQALAFGPQVPVSSVNTGVLSCRYTPDGSHILIPDTLAGKMFQSFPIKDTQTAWGTVHTGPTVATGITQGNDALVTPNGQYLVVGGAGGAIFHQTSPWNICIQMGASLCGQSTT
jgi:hypothetical protein